MPFDPTADAVAPGGDGVTIPGIYRRHQQLAAQAAARVDPRIAESKLDAGSRRVANSTSPVTKQGVRELEKYKHGEPVLMHYSALAVTPMERDRIPFLRREVTSTTEERDAQCYQVRVWPDDRVSVGETVAQMKRRSGLVSPLDGSPGYPVGEIDLDGDYHPLGFNPETQRWQRIDFDVDEIEYQ